MDLLSFFGKFPLPVLCDISLASSGSTSSTDKTLKKEDYVKALALEVGDEGINILVKRMKRPLLEECTKYVPENVLNKGNKATRISSTSVMGKRVKELMTEKGLLNFLTKYVNEKQLIIECLTLCEVHVDGNTSQNSDIDEFRSMLNVEVGKLGMWNLLDHYAVVDLHYFASKLDLTIQSNNKQVIIGAITSYTDYNDESDKNNSKKKKLPGIGINTTVYDLTCYEMDDLVEFCDKNDLVHKSQNFDGLVQMITDHLYQKRFSKTIKLKVVSDVSLEQKKELRELRPRKPEETKVSQKEPLKKKSPRKLDFNSPKKQYSPVMEGEKKEKRKKREVTLRDLTRSKPVQAGSPYRARTTVNSRANAENEKARAAKVEFQERRVRTPTPTKKKDWQESWRRAGSI